MWRSFLAEIAIGGVVVTVLATILAARMLNMDRPESPSEGDDIGWDCQDEPFETWQPLAVSGRARLCQGPSGVLATIDADKLAPGGVYEGWLVYTEAPTACAATPCPLSQLLHGNPPGLFTRFGVAMAMGTRRARFVGRFEGLTLARGSQVQLLVLYRGPRLHGADQARQFFAASWPSGRDDRDDDVVVARTYVTVGGMPRSSK